jgi:tRNA1(Val) A37 N6-methylase TrmN6
VFCFPTAQLSRALSACRAASLPILTMRDVVPREGVTPLFTLFCCAHEGPAEPLKEAPFVVRDRAGVHTAEMTAARGLFGMQDQRTKP